MKKPTYGESVFEAYLVSQGIAFDREPKLPGISQLIDFDIDHPRRTGSPTATGVHHAETDDAGGGAADDTHLNGSSDTTSLACDVI